MQAGQQISMGTLRKRPRVPLACTSCRHRKSRCMGQRPRCSSCVELRMECVYEEVPQNYSVKRQAVQTGEAHLARRVRDLEARLASVADQPSDTSLANSTPEEIEGRHARDRSSMSAPISVTPKGLTNHIVTEVPVDTLATGAFHSFPERNIGCFGPTSNHALFRNLSSVYAQRTRQYLSARMVSSEQGMDHYLPSRPLSPKSSDHPIREKPSSGYSTLDPYAVPDFPELIRLINRFFASVGAVMPYISKSAVLSECQRVREGRVQELSRPTLALLNIVCAWALCTLRHADAEAFYHRTLILLDERTLRGSCLELVQALLLLCALQQNNQRSIASWTFHAMAVKAAFQLGLHSPVAYEEHRVHDSELRKRLWYGVINQDRSLSISLGRPFLIPPQYVRIETPQNPSTTLKRLPIATQDNLDSLHYFNAIISLNAIKATAIESLYDSNIEGFTPLQLQELITRQFHLSCQLEDWRDTTSSFCEIFSSSDLQTESAGWYDTKRLQILLSIEYYSTVLLINCPILTGVLSQDSQRQEAMRKSAHVLEAARPVIIKDCDAAKELLHIINNVTVHGGTFLDCNAAWWTCNYLAFTISLHLFAILLAHDKGNHNSLALTLTPDLDFTEIRASLNHAMQTLKAIERTSLMSRKARHCLQGFLDVFDTLSDQQSLATHESDSSVIGTAADNSLESMAYLPQNMAPEGGGGTSSYSQFVAQSADDFLFQCSQDAFLDAEFGMFQQH